jgi:ribosomal protein L37E
MTHTPSIDYSCSRCGADQTYHLVPVGLSEAPHHPPAGSPEITSIDLRCSRCGANQTFKLVPAAVRASAG